MSAIDDLQTAASRFAEVAGFGSITADGVMGPQTMNATQMALSWIVDNVGPPDNATAAAIITNASTEQLMASSASDVAVFLNGVADDQGLAGSNLDVPGSGGGGGGSKIRPPILPVRPAGGVPMTASLSVAWANLPVPVKIGAGLLAVGAIVAVGGHYMKNRRRRR